MSTFVPVTGRVIARALVVAAGLALTACASSDVNVVRMSNVWSTTCNGGGQNVVVSAKTLKEFHQAIESTPECARGYTAAPPSN